MSHQIQQNQRSHQFSIQESPMPALSNPVIDLLDPKQPSEDMESLSSTLIVTNKKHPINRTHKHNNIYQYEPNIDWIRPDNTRPSTIQGVDPGLTASPKLSKLLGKIILNMVWHHYWNPGFFWMECAIWSRNGFEPEIVLSSELYTIIKKCI